MTLTSPTQPSSKVPDLSLACFLCNLVFVFSGSALCLECHKRGERDELEGARQEELKETAAPARERSLLVGFGCPQLPELSPASQGTPGRSAGDFPGQKTWWHRQGGTLCAEGLWPFQLHEISPRRQHLRLNVVPFRRRGARVVSAT